MRSPLANYVANDSVNNKQQYTATNGNALRPPEQESKLSSTKKTETFNISTTERKTSSFLHYSKKHNKYRTQRRRDATN